MENPDFWKKTDLFQTYIGKKVRIRTKVQYLDLVGDTVLALKPAILKSISKKPPSNLFLLTRLIKLF